MTYNRPYDTGGCPATTPYPRRLGHGPDPSTLRAERVHWRHPASISPRDDIGERWVDGDGDRLQAWGYLGPD